MITAYVEMLGPLKAQEQLARIEAVSVPKWKPDSARSVLSRLSRIARRERPKTVSEQLIEQMDVVYEPTKEGRPDGG